MTNNNNFLTLEYIFITSLIIAVSALVLIYGTAYYFISDGFSLIEVSSLPLISLVFVLLASSVSLFISLKKYNQLNHNIKKIKNLYFILNVIAVTAIFIFLIDIFMYAIIDKTLSINYIEYLEVVYKQYGKSVKDADSLKNLPFILQNGAIVAMSLVVGSFSSLFLLNNYKKTKLKSELQTV